MPVILNAFSQLDLPASNTTLYTAPVGSKVLVTSVVVCNKTVTDRTVSVDIVRSGGTPVIRLFSATSVPANQSAELIQGKGIVLAAGDALRAIASAAAALDVAGSVVEET